MRTIVDLPEAERQQQPRHDTVFGLWRDRSDDALTMQDALCQE